jgi:molybdopterin-guanine dinucleotide biosynthesis protein A
MFIERTESISGVILAGGENKRFGGINKSNIVIGGSSIISRIIDTISDIFGEIIIVTNTPDEFRAFDNYKMVADQFRQIGPLGGIHSALNASSKDSVFIFAGDMPFLDKGMIMNQIGVFSVSAAEAIIPRINCHDEPLHAIYKNSIYNRLNRYLSEKNKYAIRDFLKDVNVNYMDLPPSELVKRTFTNINTPLEAEEATRVLRIL